MCSRLMRVGGVAVTMLVVSFVTIGMLADAASREYPAPRTRTITHAAFAVHEVGR